MLMLIYVDASPLLVHGDSPGMALRDRSAVRNTMGQLPASFRPLSDASKTFHDRACEPLVLRTNGIVSSGFTDTDTSLSPK